MSTKANTSTEIEQRIDLVDIPSKQIIKTFVPVAPEAHAALIELAKAAAAVDHYNSFRGFESCDCCPSKVQLARHRQRRRVARALETLIALGVVQPYEGSGQ